MSDDQIRDYISKVNYKNILEIVENKKIQYLLHGFSYKLTSGITFLYIKDLNEKSHEYQIERVESGKDPNNLLSSLYHPICKLFRSTKNNSYNSICEKCDCDMFKKFYLEKQKKPLLYLCHLGLWEMTYPVYNNGKLVGALVDGQVLINANIGDTVKALGNKYDIYCSDDVKDIHQFDYVILKLGSYDLDDEFMSVFKSINEYREFNKDDISGQYKTRLFTLTADELEQKYTDFCNFGKIFTEFIDSFYENFIQLEERSLIYALDKKLSNTIPYTSRDGRWAFVYKVTKEFCEALNILDFSIYSRKEDGDFNKILSSSGVQSESLKEKLDSNLVMQLERNRLIQLPDSGFKDSRNLENLIKRFRLGSGPFLLYLGDLKGRTDVSVISLLFVFQVSGLRNKKNLIHSFCQMLILRVGISEVLSQFEDRVKLVSHHVKNSAQMALSMVHGVFDHMNVIPEQVTTIDNILRFIKNEMLGLNDSYTPLCQSFDIVLLLKELINEYGPLAKEKNCEIVFSHESNLLFVELNEMEVRIALSNLIENAIKYSYNSHKVDVLLEQIKENRIRIEIRNFGIGIPNSLYNQIRRMGVRGNIEDKDCYNRKRVGSGMGLPIAIDYIENLHKGKLIINSYPADKHEREPYHRYLTKVEVVLPVRVESKKDEKSKQ